MPNTNQTLTSLDLEKKLGFTFNGGFLKAVEAKQLVSRKEGAPFKKLLDEIKAHIDNFRKSNQLHKSRRNEIDAESEKIFNEHGKLIWSDDPARNPTPWLAESSSNDLNGHYPKMRTYSQDEHQLRADFIEMLFLKCKYACNNDAAIGAPKRCFDDGNTPRGKRTADGVYKPPRSAKTASKADSSPPRKRRSPRGAETRSLPDHGEGPGGEDLSNQQVHQDVQQSVQHQRMADHDVEPSETGTMPQSSVDPAPMRNERSNPYDASHKRPPMKRHRPEGHATPDVSAASAVPSTEARPTTAAGVSPSLSQLPKMNTVAPRPLSEPTSQSGPPPSAPTGPRANRYLYKSPLAAERERGRSGPIRSKEQRRERDVWRPKRAHDIYRPSKSHTVPQSAARAATPGVSTGDKTSDNLHGPNLGTSPVTTPPHPALPIDETPAQNLEARGTPAGSSAAFSDGNDGNPTAENDSDAYSPRLFTPAFTSSQPPTLSAPRARSTGSSSVKPSDIKAEPGSSTDVPIVLDPSMPVFGIVDLDDNLKGQRIDISSCGTVMQYFELFEGLCGVSGDHMREEVRAIEAIIVDKTGQFADDRGTWLRQNAHTTEVDWLEVIKHSAAQDGWLEYRFKLKFVCTWGQKGS